MDTMVNVWTIVEHVRVASSAAELAIFTAIIYWFFTSSRVADMLEVVGERVGGWCGLESTQSLRQAVRARRRHHQDMYAKLDAEIASRASSLYRLKESSTVPAPQISSRVPPGLACARCAPDSRESWQDPKCLDPGTVLNILDIGKQDLASGGVIARYFYDVAQSIGLRKYQYKDVVPNVLKDERFQNALEETTQEELRKIAEQNEQGGGESKAVAEYSTVRRMVEARSTRILNDLGSALSNNVLMVVAWLCYKAVRRIAGGGCGVQRAGLERLRRASAAGLPLVFVPLHRSHFDYVLLTFTMYLGGLRPPLVAAGDNLRIPLFGWFLRGCGAFYIRRRVNGSENQTDHIYKAALRAYIINSLADHNNLEFYIEGGRTRTGKPQLPKAGILSVILDAYLEGAIEDALLVPVTMNYDRLVDGNFVREQLGMPKRMETFWSALTGIWRTLNTDHGCIRVDYNQPISLKELVMSYKKYNYLRSPVERPLSPINNNLALNLDRQILYNHSHSSLYGDEVSTDYKIMVEAIGRHLVYDASQATALMSTNVLSYVLLTEERQGCTMRQLRARVEGRTTKLVRAGRELGYCGDTRAIVEHAIEMLGRGLVRREGSGEKQMVRPQLSIAASLELSYYANSLVALYAPTAILATALEAMICQPNADQEWVRHSELMENALQLCEVLSHEFILCPPCRRIEEQMLDAIDELVAADVIAKEQNNLGLEEQRWSMRFAKSLEEDSDEESQDPMRHVKYKVSHQPEALEERRRLLLSIRPLLEAYSATCRALSADSVRNVVRSILNNLTEEYTQQRMQYGEAVSSDAIHNCLRLLKHWGVIAIEVEGKDRRVRIRAPYDNKLSLDNVCENVYKFNMESSLLKSN